MKMAEEWMKQISGESSNEPNDAGIITTHEIEQIQHDAWKQGMTDAAKIATADLRQSVAELILNTRDVTAQPNDPSSPTPRR